MVGERRGGGPRGGNFKERTPRLIEEKPLAYHFFFVFRDGHIEKVSDVFRFGL